MFGAILIAGMVGAAIDAVYFSSLAVIAGRSPVQTLQAIASFWLGPKSTELGATSALLGIATHIALATIMAFGFYIVTSRIEVLPSSAVKFGLLYGCFLYLLMYLVVLPLRWPTIFPRWDGWRSVGDVTIHLIISVTFALLIVPRSAIKALPMAG